MSVSRLNLTSPAARERSARNGAPGEGSRIMLTTDAVGGVWRYSLELAAALPARALLVSLGPSPSAVQRAEAAAICELYVTDLPLDWLAGSSTQLANAAHELCAFAAEWGADSVHLHTPALIPGGNWRMPVVAVAHSCVGTWWRAVRGDVSMPADLAWRAALVGEGLRQADAALAPSRAFARELSSLYGARVQSIHNGRRPLKSPSRRRDSVLTAGRLWDEGKNVAALDAAAALIDAEFRAAGPTAGPNGTALAARHLRLLGGLDEPALAAEYARAAIFVSAARYEPFGLAVLEAAQSGCALVLSDIPTFRELWDGIALFVDPDDPRVIAAAVGEALHRPDLRHAARARASAYTLEAMATATFAVHRALYAACVS